MAFPYAVLRRAPFAACLFLAAATAVSAEPASLRVLTPPDLAGPTTVEIEVTDLQIFRIQEQEELFHVGGRIHMRWMDPRQAFDSQAAGTWRLEYQGQSALDKLDADVWWPELEIVDAVGTRDRMAVNLTLDSDGEVWYRERFNVQIKQDFYLGSFPYDQHRISFALEPFTYRSSAVRFVAPPEQQQMATWEPTEWVVQPPMLEISDGIAHYCVGAQETAGPFGGGCEASDCAGGTTCESDFGFPRATVAMDIARVSSSYTGNFIVPLALIVLIATAVFWIDFDKAHLGDRLVLSFTSLLTVVAFDFVTSNSLPKLWYSTVLDRIVTVSYVFLAINIAASVLIDRMYAAGDRPRLRALRLNSLSRWTFPAVYLAALAFLIIGSG